MNEEAVKELLDAWESNAHTVMYEFSSDFDTDKAKIAQEKVEWYRRIFS